MTTFETILVTAMGTGLLGIGALISYVIKAVLPKVLKAFEDRNLADQERNAALVKSADKTADAVTKIPEALKSFEVTITATETRLVDRISLTGEKIAAKIDDRRLDAVMEELRRRGEGAAVVPPGGE